MQDGWFAQADRLRLIDQFYSETTNIQGHTGSILVCPLCFSFGDDVFVKLLPSVGNEVFHSVTPRLLKNLRLQLDKNRRLLIPRITLQDLTLRVKGKDRPWERETLFGLAHLIAGHNENPVIKSPGWKMSEPAFHFSIRIASWTGMGHEKNLRPFQAERRADFREMGLVAKLQAESQVALMEYIETVSLPVVFFLRGREMGLSVKSQESTEGPRQLG